MTKPLKRLSGCPLDYPGRVIHWTRQVWLSTGLPDKVWLSAWPGLVVCWTRSSYLVDWSSFPLDQVRLSAGPGPVDCQLDLVRQTTGPGPVDNCTWSSNPVDNRTSGQSDLVQQTTGPGPADNRTLSSGQPVWDLVQWITGPEFS